MKINTALLLSTAIIFTTTPSVTAAGGCVTGATSDRDQCLCRCIRSGYDCETGVDLMVDASDAELKERCTSNIVAGGPCKWDPDASRPEDGSACTNSCPSTTFCNDGGGGGDGTDSPTSAPEDKCASVTCVDGDCPGNCCVRNRGSCGGPKRLRS